MMDNSLIASTTHGAQSDTQQMRDNLRVEQMVLSCFHKKQKRTLTV